MYKKITLFSLIIAIIPAHSIPLAETISKHKLGLAKIGCVTALSTGWAALSYICYSSKSKMMDEVYQTERAIFTKLSAKLNRITAFDTAPNSIQRKKDLGYLLTDLKNNFARTNFVFNRLVLEFSLFDTEAQQKAWCEFKKELPWNGGHLHDHKLENTVCDDLEYYFGRYARTNSLFCIYFIEQPAWLFSKLHKALYPNETKEAQEKVKALELAVQFKELIAEQSALIMQIEQRIDSITKSPEYLQEMAQLPWWEKALGV